MARLGKRIPPSLQGPIARRLPGNSSRNGLSDIPDNQHKKNGIRIVKMNQGIVEKILLMLFAALVLLFTILQLR